MSFARHADALLRSVKIGQLLGGEYRVVSVIGAGAISIVVRAERISDHEKFAVRVFDGAWIRKAPGGLDAFMRDANKLRTIDSNHVMRLFSAGIAKDENPYLVFEYLEGVDLRRAVTEKESLWVGDAAEFARQACDGLAKAHALGLVHRDLRPENFFLVRGPNDSLRLKVTGFGLGAVADGPHASGEQSTQSLAYASPELLAGNPVDSRADVWSLGITLFEWVTGTRPYDVYTLANLLKEKRALVPPKMKSALGIPVPEGFERVVRKCLEVYPRNRFRNAGELSIALAPFPNLAAPDAVVATIAHSPDARAITASSKKTIANDMFLEREAPTPLNTTSPMTPPTPRTPTAPTGPRAPRPVFSSDADAAPESKTLIRPAIEVMPIELPPVIVVKMESSKWWRFLAGAIALVILLALPVAYVHFHGRTVPPPPDPDVAQSAVNARDNAPPKVRKRPPHPASSAGLVN